MKGQRVLGRADTEAAEDDMQGVVEHFPEARPDFRSS